MFRLGLLCAFLIAVSAEDMDSCYDKSKKACNSLDFVDKKALFTNCNAVYGNIMDFQADLQAYVNAHIESSFEFLLMSTHFGNYEANRDGFKTLYRKLSDKTWEDAFDLIKFIAKRGGKMNFNQLPRIKGSTQIKSKKILQLNEIHSLSKALDIEKQLAEEALYIHSRAQQHSKQDASVAHYLEEQFLEPQSDVVRQLAGHITDLKKLLTDHDASLSVFMFDEYLKKLM
ncbi:PREDICTED: ferritin light chain, oocyte isoform [Polistes dominula]|uniref:Ferritin n=1 Tax=Polistes dominula TaxID=743375 RepID=A0ABM1HT57_POLDO|nr:PREDICTED: ferritin light chain, oocyte isoform [Polistes dominula]XP_015171145.1 PREDICTED: ferritin light chain, oocyte isoform [Polistes dominula]